MTPSLEDHVTLKKLPLNKGYGHQSEIAESEWIQTDLKANDDFINERSRGFRIYHLH